MKKNYKKLNGFTIVEMLVTTFIISLLSAILVVNWRENEKNYLVQRVAQEIVQNIRKAQGMALNGKQMFWSPTNKWIVPKSYGIHFSKSNPTFYFIYGDYIGNAGYQSPEDIEETNTWIEAGVEIDSFSGGNVLDVSFEIPDGFISFYPSGTSAKIVIKRTGRTCPSVSCRTIELTSAGEINIK